jgi:hypothetical protein
MDEKQPAVKQCRACDRAWGAFGIVMGLVVLAIGLDLMTGGALTRAASPRKLATVTDIRSKHDNAG